MSITLINSHYRQVNSRVWAGFVEFPIEWARYLAPHRRALEWSPSNGVSYTAMSPDERNIVLGFSNASEDKVISDINKLTRKIEEIIGGNDG